jgi:hypothetical protein
MSKKCQFDSNTNQFHGTPLEQAQCLLRFPKALGEVGDAPAAIPKTLTGILTNRSSLGFTKELLRKVLNKRGIAETNIGGSLDQSIARANNNDEAELFANYFVIHDTSTQLDDDENFDPAFINTSKWSGNHLETLPNVTHVFITRNGRTKTSNDYGTAFRATRFELSLGSDVVIHKGRFLHHELVQPRKPKIIQDDDSPIPGFTPVQYELLAICYLAASVRRGSWLIPAFHCVIDLFEDGGHDDPQRFDLDAWDSAIANLLSELAQKPNPILTPLRSNFFKNDPVLQKVARGELMLVATGGLVAGIGAVQDALNSLASSQPGLAINLGGNRGSFGPRTKTAITLFQKLHSLPETGKVDSKTLLILDGVVA